MFVCTYTQIINGVQWRIEFRPYYPGEQKLPGYNYFNFEVYGSDKLILTRFGAYLPGGLNEYDAKKWLECQVYNLKKK